MRPMRYALATSRGSCPNCGHSVARLQRRNAAGASDTYDCRTCGTFAYSTRGPRLPLVVPVR